MSYLFTILSAKYVVFSVMFLDSIFWSIIFFVLAHKVFKETFLSSRFLLIKFIALVYIWGVI